jgi:hypothetical protein
LPLLLPTTLCVMLPNMVMIIIVSMLMKGIYESNC